MTLAKGRLDLHIKPARVRFDDHQWHKIVVHRKVQEVTIVIILSVYSRINDEISVKYGSQTEFDLGVSYRRRWTLSNIHYKCLICLN